MNVGNGERSAYRVTRSPETRGRLLNLEIHRRCFPAVLFDLKLDLLPFIERAQSSALDRGDVDEHVFAASLRLDKSIALGWIEPSRCRAPFRSPRSRSGVMLFWSLFLMIRRPP